MSRHHDLPTTPQTVVWGTFDAAIPAAIEIESGDTVSIRALPGC